MLAAGGALAGCGGDTAAVLAPGAADSAVTKAQAVAYAQAVNLRATDLPGMNASSPEHEGKAPTRLELALARCDGEQDPQQRSSTASRLRSPPPPKTEAKKKASTKRSTQASKSYQPRRSPRSTTRRRSAPVALTASSASFRPPSRRKTRERLRYGPVTLQQPIQPPTGRPRQLRHPRSRPSILGVPSQIAATPPHVYIDILGFLSGASEINLTATGFPEPVGEEAEQHLLIALYDRAQANKL